MDPAPGGARGRRQHVDEGGDVVVGDRLALGDRLDGERRGADRLEVLGRRPVLERLGGGDLDVAPRGHARLVGPDGAELGAGVAGDHARTARGPCGGGRASGRGGEEEAWHETPPAVFPLSRGTSIDCPSGDERQEKISEVLVAAFEELIEADPRAFRRKFRKMAADPFAFYRGSAVLFYDDVARLEDPWADERTGRVWIQGDLHAENYGTYMDSAGIFVFDVNDFDEAYLGHYTWDLQRMAASLALLGFGYALSDETIEQMIVTYGRAYVEQVRAFATGDRDEEFRLTLETTDGLLQRVPPARADPHPAGPARVDDDARGPRAALLRRAGRAAARRRRARVGARGLRRLPRDDPRDQAPAERLLRRQGRRRAQGLRHRQRRPARVQPARRGAHAGARQRRRAVDEAGQHPGPEPRRRQRPAARVLQAPGPPHGGLAAGAAGPLRPVARLVRARRRGPGRPGALARTRTTSTGPRSPSPTRSSRCCATSARRPRRSTASRTPPATSRSSTSRSRRR